jgi:ATP-binding cassette, subfamily B, multidrug efflux pump
MSGNTQSDTGVLSDLALLGRLWPHMRPDAWCFVYGMAVSPLVVACGLVQPYLVKVAIDDHISAGIAEGLAGLALLYLGSGLVSYLLAASYTVAIAYGGQRMLVRLRNYLYKRVLSLPQSFFDSRPAGVLLTRLTSDVDALGESIGAGVVTIVLDLLMITGCLGMMFYLDPVLSLIMVLCSPLLVFVLEVLRRKLKGLFLEIRDAIAQVNAFLAEHIDGVEILQLFSAERRAQAEFNRRNSRFRDACTTSNIYDSLMYAIVDGMGSVFIALLLWYGTGLMARSGLPVPEIEPRSAGVMVAFIDYLNRLLGPIRDLSSKVAVIQRAVAALSKIFGLVDVEDPMPRDGVPMERINGRIELDGLRFRYSAEGPEVLKGISLAVEPGEVVAIVGSSGSGKTTLARLLDKSYTGYGGSIRIDGEELSGIAMEDARRRVAAVRQDIQVFSASLGFNVDMGNAAISEEMRQEAAGLTHALRFVERLGWEHCLRERGSELSVGEGQLLTFARTMAHDPDVVILDEATASVDSITEALIQEAISSILERKTVIVIAHRLSTIQKADRIVVLEKGEIVESGRHQDLLRRGGRYAELIQAAKAVSA